MTGLMMHSFQLLNVDAPESRLVSGSRQYSMNQEGQNRSLESIHSVVALLATQYPLATDFLQFRLYARCNRIRRGRVHGGVNATIQPRDAQGWKPESEEALRNAAKWLFVSTLFSEVVYTYFRNYFDGTKFKKQLLFPEVTGDCPGACGVHIEPRAAVQALLGVGLQPHEISDSIAVMEADAEKWLRLICNNMTDDVLQEMKVAVIERAKQEI